MTEEDRPKLEIDWVRTAAGALAAVSSAVLLSTLGAAGTIIGAALGSVVITVGGAVYSHGLARSRDRLSYAQAAALRKVGIAQAEVRRAGEDEQGEVDAHLDHAEEVLADAKEDLDAPVDEPAVGWRERLAGLRWQRVAVAATALFAVSVLAITGFELIAGRSVSDLTGGSDGTGGTTVGRIGGGGQGGSEDDPSAPDAPAEEDSPEDAEPDAEPSAEPDEGASESPEPEATPTPTPSATPTLPSDPAPSSPTG